MARGANWPLLFASSPHDPRSRRPTDIALAIVSTIALLLTSVLAQLGTAVEEEMTAVLAHLPAFLEPLWLACAWAPLLWALVVLSRGAGPTPPDAGARHARRRRRRRRVGDARGPLGRRRHLGAVRAVRRPRRTPGVPARGDHRRRGRARRRLAPPQPARSGTSAVGSMPASSLGVVLLGAATTGGAVVAVAVGLLGRRRSSTSSSARPAGGRRRRGSSVALRELGVDVAELAPATMQPSGVVRFDGTDARRPAARQGLRPRRLGRPAAGQPLAPGVVPRRRSARPASAGSSSSSTRGS